MPGMPIVIAEPGEIPGRQSFGRRVEHDFAGVVAMAFEQRLKARARKRPEVSLADHRMTRRHDDVEHVVEKLPGEGPQGESAFRRGFVPGIEQPLLDGSLATNGQPSTAARCAATVDFPLAG